MSTDAGAAHPREFAACAGCDDQDPEWTEHRTLPQVGQTYIHEACGHEVYVYDVGDPNETRRRFRPVTDTMATNLQFFALTGGWPDDVCEDLLRRGVERQAAIDYYAVEREDLSQSEWARRRGVAQQSVSGNVSEASDRLNGDA